MVLNVDCGRGNGVRRLHGLSRFPLLVQVQEHVSDKPVSSWIRFSTAGRSLIELTLHVKVVAAEPSAWTAAAVDGGPETQGVDAEGHIKCGQFFRLELSAVDAFNNRSLLRHKQKSLEAHSTVQLQGLAARRISSTSQLDTA